MNWAGHGASAGEESLSRASKLLDHLAWGREDNVLAWDTAEARCEGERRERLW